MNKRLLLGLFLIITPGLYASEDAQFEREREAKERSAAINAGAEFASSLTQEELEGTQDQKAERVAVLKAAFNGCRGPQDMLTDEQLEYFPTDLGNHIASFLDDRPKHKFIARHTLQCIPVVMRRLDLLLPGTYDPHYSVMVDISQVLSLFDRNPKPHTITKEIRSTGSRKVKCYVNSKYSVVTGKDMLLAICNKNNDIVFKLHPAYIKELLKLTEVQLNYILWLFDTYDQQMSRFNEDDDSSVETRNRIRERVGQLSLEQRAELARRTREAGKLTRTPEQVAIHNSLPEDMRRCLERNYEFTVPVPPAAAAVEASE